MTPEQIKAAVVTFVAIVVVLTIIGAIVSHLLLVSSLDMRLDDDKGESDG